MCYGPKLSTIERGHMESTSAFVAIGAGLLSFISPCVLPLVPVYLASLTGDDVFESKEKRIRLPIFLHALSFVIGFSLVFTLFGILAALIGFTISIYSTLVTKLTGGLLIALGIFIIAAIKIPWLNFEKRFAPRFGVRASYLRSFLIGGVFSVAWTPCVGPILGSILTLALNSTTVWQGAALLALYSLGLGIPFLVLGLIFDFLIPLIKRIQRYADVFYFISGILLITIGILTILDRLVWLQG